VARRDFRTPASIPVETTGRCIVVPNSPEWLGLLNAALLMLAEQWRYVQVETTDLTPEETANAWYAIYVQSLLSNCESAMFDLRVSPTDDCLIEKTTDGITWVSAFRLDTDCALTKIIRNPNTGEYGWEVEDVGFYRFPDGPYVPNAPVYAPPPRVRTGSDITERCAAAYAAALVLQSLYQQTWDVFTTTMAESALSFSKALIDLFEVIPALSIPLDWMLERAEDGLEGGANFVQGGFPNSVIEDVQNILFCRATVTGGRVVFDHAGVLSDFQAEVGSPYDGLAFLLFLYVTADMLNAAGNVDAGLGNCAAAECNSDWCYEFDFTVSSHGWYSDHVNDPQPPTATAEYVSGSGWKDLTASSNDRVFIRSPLIAATDITGIEAMFAGGGLSGDAPKVQFFRQTIPPAPFADLLGEVFSSSPTTLVNPVGVTVDAPGTTILRVAWDRASNATAQKPNTYLEKLRVYGTGTSPFGSSNC